MFGADERDMVRALSEMEREARTRCNWDQVAAKETMKQWLASDRRFDAFDATKLVDRTLEVKGNGRNWDLSDPFLQRNGSKRPLSF